MNFFNQMGFGGGGGGGFGGPPGGHRAGIESWSSILKSVPSYTVERQDINRGNKVILPSTILGEIAHLNLPQPMIFQLQTFDKKKTVHVGVIEFVAPEETVILPWWIFKSLGIRENAMLIVTLNPA